VLTVKEAAAAVRLTQWAIYRAIQRGELTAYKPCGRLRIHKDDLDAWLESTRVPVEARAAAAPSLFFRQSPLRVGFPGDRPTVVCGPVCGPGEPSDRARERPR
jgi:excisionase family DNA binding protein